jgi:hypothetical protein
MPRRGIGECGADGAEFAAHGEPREHQQAAPDDAVRHDLQRGHLGHRLEVQREQPQMTNAPMAAARPEKGAGTVR